MRASRTCTSRFWRRWSRKRFHSSTRKKSRPRRPPTVARSRRRSQMRLCTRPPLTVESGPVKLKDARQHLNLKLRYCKAATAWQLCHKTFSGLSLKPWPWRGRAPSVAFNCLTDHGSLEIMFFKLAQVGSGETAPRPTSGLCELLRSFAALMCSPC